MSRRRAAYNLFERSDDCDDIYPVYYPVDALRYQQHVGTGVIHASVTTYKAFEDLAPFSGSWRCGTMATITPVWDAAFKRFLIVH